MLYVFRYKVVAQHRNVKLEDEESEEASGSGESKPYDMFDVIRDNNKDDVITCNGVPLISEPAVPLDAFVYDIYMPVSVDGSDVEDRFIDEMLSVQPYAENSYMYNNSDDDDVSDAPDDQYDSNAEDYSGNDYPDESDEEDDVLAAGMNRWHIKDDYDDDDGGFDDNSLLFNPASGYNKYRAQLDKYKRNQYHHQSHDEDSDDDDEFD